MSSDPEKLIKLVRLLSSNRDGEVLGAVRAIERVLKANGFTFHDLAESLAGRILEVVKIKVIERVVEVDKSQKDWIEAANKILAAADLPRHERKFVEDMRRNFELYSRFEPSQKQTAWFVILYRKHVQDAKQDSTCG